MQSKYKWSSILVAFAIVGLLAFWPSQSAEAAKCIEDPLAKEEFRVALNSSINDEGYLVVDDAGTETQPPLHWKNKSIRLSWDTYPGAEYRLRRHDAKSDKIDANGNYLEVYAQLANDAEEWSTATTAVRPNHASAMRFWYVDLKLNGKIMDTAQIYWVEVRCGQTNSSSQHMRARFLTKDVGSDPAPTELAYPKGTYVTNIMWNPRVEAILAARREAAGSTEAVPATTVPATPEPTTAPAPEPTPEPAATPEPTPEPAATPEPTIAPTLLDPVPAELTAEFRNVPTTHNGRDSFTMEIHFSEDIPELGFRTIRDTALEVTNGRITKAKRQTKGSNQGWVITVQPASRQAVEIELSPTTSCTAAGAICSADGAKLSSGLLRRIVSTQVDRANMPELTAEFRNVPSAHNGTSRFTLELHFSENIPELSYKTVHASALEVENGRITRAHRYVKGSNQGWVITIQPTAQQTVTVELPATTDCDDTGAICLPDGAKVSSSLLAQISYE